MSAAIASGLRAAQGLNLRLYDGIAWQALALALGARGALNRAKVLSEALRPLSDARIARTIAIPARAIVRAVSTRSGTTILGASAYKCGIAGAPAKFGGNRGIAAVASNIAAIGPQAFYAAMPIVLTTNGRAFTGGVVRMAIHLVTFVALVPR